ncbi:MAG: hypothetical protein WC735_02350 [Candidatus Paceibacterota bacterium]|jgi:hypothetical protein
MEENKINAEHNLSFEKKQHKKDVALYVFNHVVIAIDTSGKNYKELPEILFGTFNTEYNKDSKNQPELRREGVDMKYISACIKEVAKDSGINEFWLYPNGEDKPENERKREQARLRLFRSYVNLTPALNGFGYIMKV